jgi:hypothetical protein
LNNSAFPNGAELLTKANTISANIMGVGKEIEILNYSVLLDHNELLTNPILISDICVAKKLLTC